VIVISLQVKMLGNSGLLTICYPYVTFEPIMKELVAEAGRKSRKRGIMRAAVKSM